MATRTPGPLHPAEIAVQAAPEDNDNTNQQAACSETFPKPKCPGVPTSDAEFAFLEPAKEPNELGWLGVHRVVKVLGQGGMGIVFLAEDTRLGRLVALKVMHADLAKDETSRQRFTREARATATIRSDHIVAIHEIGEANNLPYIVTELLQGRPLDAWLTPGQPPDVAKVLDISLQIARGLDASHRAGVIHRDIKPANIWMEEPSGRIKILDFGLARTAKAGVDLTQDGAVLGTPAYMAPEQAEGKPIDERCDLFSLGCVLYLLATGARAFDGPSTIAVMRAIALDDPKPIERHRPQLPAAFCSIVMQLLAKNPEHRPATATAVVEALLAIDPTNAMAPRQSTAAPVFSVPRRSTPQRRKKIACAVGLLGLLTVAAVFGVIMLGASYGEQPQAPGLPPVSLQDDEIVLGMSAPFSGPARELGRGVEVGMRTYFDHVNEQGGIAGRKIKLISLDDGYLPERALANMKELLEQRRAFAIIGNVGTATAESAMPFVLSKKHIFFGGVTGAPVLRRDPPDRYVFNFRASYAEETAAIVNYMIESKGLFPEQIAVFAQQDAYGDAGFDGVVKTLRKFGRKPEQIVRVGHVRNSIHVGDAVQQLLAHKDIRAVVMVSTYRPAAEFIRQMKDAKADLLFANISFVGSAALAEELLETGPEYPAGVIVTQVVPHPASHSTLAMQYREHLAKYYPKEKAGFGCLEGYIDAAIFTEGLRRAGSNLTTETLVEALESIHNHDLGLGTPMQFSRSEHQASHKVWGTILDAAGQFKSIDLE